MFRCVCDTTWNLVIEILFKQMLRYVGENVNTKVHFQSIQPLVVVFCLALQSHDNK